MKKLMMLLLIGTMSLSMLAGCGKKGDSKEEPSSVKVEADLSVVEEVDEPDPHEGQARSFLTGEWIDEELAKKRPLAVMTGNTEAALPAYGISDADVIYEAPVEGMLTRIMAIYPYEKYTKAKKIMSVRSCRHYYIDWALEYDALYAHYGQAKYAKKMLAKDFVHNLNGMEGAVSNVMYKRDSSRKAPHNAYTTGKGILAGIEKKGYRTEYSDDYEGHFKFNEDEENEIQLANGKDAIVVKPGYKANNPWFEYDSKKGVYKRFQRGGKQVDGNNDTQLEVKNIIMEVCDWKVIDEKYGYLNVDTTSGGKGMYITNGKAIPVTWSKDSQTAPTKYFDENGEEITLNTGKTWVCIIADTYADDMAVYASKEDYKAAK